MLQSFPFEVAAFVGAWLASVGLLWGLFERVDSVASPEVKRRMSAWIRDADPRQRLNRLSALFVDAFDHVFGERHLSWRCFSRSVVASFLFTFVVTLVFLSYSFDYFAIEVDDVGEHGVLTLSLGLVVLLVILTLFFNALPDYVSLFETRVAIGLVRRTSSRATFAAILVVDVVLTAIISGALCLAMYGTVNAAPSGAQLAWDSREYWSGFWQVLTRWDAQREFNGPPIWIFFWSGFFTSAWLWLFVAGGFLARLALPAQRMLGFARYALDVDGRPFLALAAMAIVVVTAGFIVAGGLALALS
ncbi:MAG: hypothetical protein QNJ91_13500 [Gammaproteobacteria bacterium]|nr:hypothetical protein [Gammaproteobacteria bacterium]